MPSRTVNTVRDIADEPLPPSGVLSARTLHFPVRIRSAPHARSVLQIARALAAGAHAEAEAMLNALRRAPALTEIGTGTPCVSPTLRAKALAAVLFDLATAGWTVWVDEGQVYLSAPESPDQDNAASTEAMIAEKERVRRTMASRVSEQLSRGETQRFIRRLESPRFTAEGPRSILSLFADGARLARALRERGADAVQPYLERALGDDGCDATTGLPLCEIFRYFRYYWSFPVNSAPGRTIPFLIRDAGQPGAPICGLLAIASPVPKLGVRDTALGWTPAWLEAVVAALAFCPDDPANHLRHVDREVRRFSEAVDPASVFAGVAELLRLGPSRDVESIACALRRLAPKERRRRVTEAHGRLLSDLRTQVTSSLDNICFDGFRLTHAAALASPTKAIDRLEVLSATALKDWKHSRALSSEGHRAGRDNEKAALERAARDPLFRKKRAAQAARLLRAWREISPVQAERPAERLRELVLGRSAPGTVTLSGGAEVVRGLRTALAQRQTAFVASQVADVSICGALAPYGPLLGGKLAALLALSREVAALYHARYSGIASVITSQMAGRPVYRPADLVALTTTSFYAVGSAQYERVKLPDQLGAIGWRYVGLSRGHGTLHFSRETTESVQALMELETGRRLISCRFGEGPSERMRKLRDGLLHVGLDANAFVTHGMARRVYVAELKPTATMPGVRTAGVVTRRGAPEAAAIAAFWRSRWLGPRLARSPELLAEVAAFDGHSALLSTRLPATSSDGGAA
jgi:hypothetical protein